MKLTADESRALAFIAGLLFLSAAVRFATLPEPMAPPVNAGFDLDAHIAATEEAVAEEERRGRPLAAGERIDPNTAPESELDRLPGVGPALAGRIAAARKAERFRSVEDLTRVAGIGPRTVERLAPHLALPRARSRAAPDEGERRRTPRGTGDAGVTVNVNAASVDELVSLPGVGPVLAGRIVAYRDSAGPFLAVDSLVRVNGIGAATLDRLRDRVRVK